MVPKYLFLLVVASLLIYSITVQENRFAATASAIRQIWSGKCNLTCQEDSCSDCSRINSQHENRNYRTSDNAGSSRDQECVCESCPCGLINQFLEKCNPAAKICETTNRAMMEYYNGVIQLFNDIYEYLARVMECRTSCLRRAELVRNEGSEQFLFGDQPAPSPSPPPPQTSKSELKRKRSSLVSFKHPEKHEDNTVQPKQMKIKDIKSEETLTPDHAISSPSGSFCKKCIEKGEACVNTCPKAKK